MRVAGYRLRRRIANCLVIVLAVPFGEQPRLCRYKRFPVNSWKPPPPPRLNRKAPASLAQLPLPQLPIVRQVRKPPIHRPVRLRPHLSHSRTAPRRL